MNHLPLRRICSLAIALMLSSQPASAQLAHGGPAKAMERAAGLPSYDVVSVKVNNSDNSTQQTSNMTTRDGLDYVATNVPLEMILEYAYDVRTDMISGLSGPVSSARFDVDAKILPPENGPPHKYTDAQLMAMVIPLLADRFHLKVHLQPKVMATYDLVVLRGGPKCKLSQEEHTGSSFNVNGSNTDFVLTAKNASMSDLAQALGDQVHRQVNNRTGVTGSCDINLKWTSDDAAADAQSESIVSIFTAVQEQLGLKLQSTKGPVDTLVIDHVEMPSQN